MSELEDDNGVSIAIPDEDPVKVEIDKPLDGGKSVEKSVEKRDEKTDERELALNELRQKLEEQKAYAERERVARAQAEQLAKEREEEAKTARSEVQDSNLRVILNAIDATEQAAAAAERAYSDAFSAGDAAAAAKAQRSMAQAEAQLLQLRNGKAALEERAQTRTTEGRVADKQPEIGKVEPPQDPVEALASRLTPKSADWLRAHPSFATQVNKLAAAHQYATEIKGIPVESPEYFAFIEGELIGGKKEAPRTQQKAPLGSIPVSSGSSNGSGSRGGSSMTLSAAEVEMAMALEPNLPRDEALKVYAVSKARLIQEGKLSA